MRTQMWHHRSTGASPLYLSRYVRHFIPSVPARPLSTLPAPPLRQSRARVNVMVSERLRGSCDSDLDSNPTRMQTQRAGRNKSSRVETGSPVRHTDRDAEAWVSIGLRTHQQTFTVTLQDSSSARSPRLSDFRCERAGREGSACRHLRGFWGSGRTSERARSEEPGTATATATGLRTKHGEARRSPRLSLAISLTSCPPGTHARSPRGSSAGAQLSVSSCTCMRIWVSLLLVLVRVLWNRTRVGRVYFSRGRAVLLLVLPDPSTALPS
ncbi:hypothetical protein OH77DRAFT_548601 [Trametes cingulata]|nr:hypothetical protein OH77DRAFT_548601 [Trametes cingulata]